MPAGCQQWAEGWTMVGGTDHLGVQETKKEKSTVSVLR